MKVYPWMMQDLFRYCLRACSTQYSIKYWYLLFSPRLMKNSGVYKWHSTEGKFGNRTGAFKYTIEMKRKFDSTNSSEPLLFIRILLYRWIDRLAEWLITFDASAFRLLLHISYYNYPTSKCAIHVPASKSFMCALTYLTYLQLRKEFLKRFK